jgi:arylsulfatase A-like enzyme
MNLMYFARITVAIVSLVFMAAGTMGACAGTPKVVSKRPNILIVLADDMGFGDIGAFGSEVETPNIDGLARSGIHFSNFHVGAACSPTRTMLMTGVDNHLAGLGNMTEIQADNQFGKPGYEGHLNDRVVTVATRLRDAGYHTYMVGKWHLGHTEATIPHARGFERSFALMESGADNWVEMPYAPMYDAVHYFDDDSQVSLPTEGYFSTNFYTERMIDYIESNHEDGKPFFAFVSYQAVHYPHQAPREYIDKYNGVYDGGWDELRRTRLARQKEIGLVGPDVELDEDYAKTSFPGWKLPDWDSMSVEEKSFNARRMQTYAGMVDNMDVNVGRLLSHLDEIGVADNTLVIFMSDNGADPNQLPLSPDFRAWYKEHYEYVYQDDYEGDYSQMGQKGSYADYGPGWAAAATTPNSYFKTFSTEGGIRVPFIARFPRKIQPGQRSRSFAFVKDIVPTLLEVAGVDESRADHNRKSVHPITGASMWSALTGKTATVHQESEAIGYELAGSSAVFRGKYKLVQNLPPKGTGDWELYDMNADPSEVHDLASQKPKIVAELVQAYGVYEEKSGVVPVPEGYNPIEQLLKNSKRGGSH